MLLAHNAAFEVRMLRQSCQRHTLPAPAWAQMAATKALHLRHLTLALLAMLRGHSLS
jgi:DNA polymerase III epsilon subunit-like protein